jgi:TetR/AcrR family transcriptional repressor of nem operon
MPVPSAASETSGRILDIAERLVQTRGFNAFSYADVADALHVTKASVHYHFPSKAKLGMRLIERYRSAFMAALDRIDTGGLDAASKLRAYVAIYFDVLDNDRMCLCGMMAADYATLPKSMQTGVRKFFEANETWLAGVLVRGNASGELTFTGSPVETARVLVATLEGAMLLARAQSDPSRMRSAADHLLSGLGVGQQAHRRALA